MTAEVIEHFRIGERGRKDLEEGFIDALCALALQSLSLESVREEVLRLTPTEIETVVRDEARHAALEEAERACESVWLSYHERTPSDNQLLHERLLGGLQASSRCKELIRALHSARVAASESKATRSPYDASGLKEYPGD